MKMFERSLFSLITTSALVLAAGCNGSKEPDKQTNTPPAAENNADHGDHDHAAHGAGPHDGTLADWGGGAYHVEFTVDHDKQQATVYVLGDDEKTAVPIEAKEIQLSISDPAMQVTLKAMPQEGESAGSASRFVGNHESLGVVQEYAGTISGVVDGTPYSGDFKEVAHAHE
jgi:hypothetical protein